ncbi:hypothetical protein GYMLUDRAFT_42223 [Collybiopsis luxurians FD-317 M1]|uniref:Unplaced genomic scaffold GYMLUscaffold_20, whole genome shotgun sequence n=1 Tax=Collybiopsis luxurians FD-317 M1 TaxID=944289 RepID=A0A0D0D020_9AGAR|nr:hypothetical protein GYMLUDRAFT_42223 [Collybiopsis luxurians FD-317 M1]
MGWRQWKNLSWGRACVLLILSDSWLFVFLAGLLSSGIGLSWSKTTCTLAIYTCISFYAISKILIYAFLSEKAYIVWTGGNQTSRFTSKVYRICAAVLLGYVVIGVLMVLGRDSTVRADGVCVIGLKSFATIPLIVYDLSLNVFLTAMFLWPLWVSNPISPRLRSVATRTLYGATISLLSSAINIVVMLVLSGNELGWVCLSGCISDVAVNSFAIFWVSSSSYSSDDIRDRYSIPELDMSALTFAQTESGRPTEGRSTTLKSPQTSAEPVILTIPEEFFDYIPPDQRHISVDFDAEKSVPLSSISSERPPIQRSRTFPEVSESLRTEQKSTSPSFATSSCPNPPPRALHNV